MAPLWLPLWRFGVTRQRLSRRRDSAARSGYDVHHGHCGSIAVAKNPSGGAPGGLGCWIPCGEAP